MHPADVDSNNVGVHESNSAKSLYTQPNSEFILELVTILQF